MADTITLTDQEAIRSWAAARAGFPAIVDVSPEAGTQAMLRLVFGQHAYQDQDQAERLAHDPEKREPIFGKDHAQIQSSTTASFARPRGRAAL
jgi:hypothetical protein